MFFYPFNQHFKKHTIALTKHMRNCLLKEKYFVGSLNLKLKKISLHSNTG